MRLEYHSEIVNVLDVASSTTVYTLRNDRLVPLIVDIVSVHFDSSATFSLDIYVSRSGVEHFILSSAVAAGLQIRQELYLVLIPDDTLTFKGTLGSGAISGDLLLNYHFAIIGVD